MNNLVSLETCKLEIIESFKAQYVVIYEKKIQWCICKGFLHVGLA